MNQLSEDAVLEHQDAMRSCVQLMNGRFIQFALDCATQPQPHVLVDPSVSHFVAFYSDSAINHMGTLVLGLMDRCANQL